MESQSIRKNAAGFDFGLETLCKCFGQEEEIEAEVCPGLSEPGKAEIRRLKKETAELKEANEILRTAQPVSRATFRPIHVEIIYQELGNAVDGLMTTRGYRAVKSRNVAYERP